MNPAALTKTCLKIINQMRTDFNLPEIAELVPLNAYARNLLSDDPAKSKWEDEESYVSISNMHFTEVYDGKKSPNELVSEWMMNPNRRPVLLSPGKYGGVAFYDSHGIFYVSVVIMSFFH